MNRNAINKIKEKVRILLKAISWRKILAFSFFVIIATILWFMQIYNQTFESNITIPIKYGEIPDSIIFNDTLPTSVNIRIKDYGYNIIKYYFKGEDTLRINISPFLNNNNGTKSLQGASFEALIRKSISQTAFIINYEPLKISLAYSPLQNKKVPVVFDGQINLSPGYFLNGDIRIVPDSITAYGSSTELGKLIYVYTTNDTVGGLDSNRKLTFNLLDIHKIKLSPKQVNVYVPIEAYTQKKVDVPVQCYNLPRNLSIKFFPSKISLSFFVGVSKADSIKTEDFSVGVDYDGLKDSKQVSVPVRITNSPEYAKSMTINPPNVEYIFEYKERNIK